MGRSHGGPSPEPRSSDQTCEEFSGNDNAQSGNGTVMVDPNDAGDSGGPVYNVQGNGTLTANGVISADLDNSSGVPDGKAITFTDLYYLGYVIAGAASS
jgi:hypothetical protein